MAEILGVGITHYPPLAGTDEGMANLLRWTLQDPDIPEEVKDPSTWPQAMQDEWSPDEGITAARRHREALVPNLQKAREAIDAFEPDLVVVWGDDQYENFREDIIPPFCVLAYDEQEYYPFKDVKQPNVWGEAADKGFMFPSVREHGKALASGLLRRGIDVSYAYEPLHSDLLPHAFLNSVLYLDYDRSGFPYPVLPFQVNCYGSRVISYRGTRSRFEAKGRPTDPPSPTPDRCRALGAATAAVFAETDLRVALVASSSWSHAFLVDKTWRLHPTVDDDRRFYDSLVSGDLAAWRGVSVEHLEEHGQQEMLNWFCLVGAMEHLDRSVVWADFTETHVLNSNKVTAVFEH